MLIAAPRAAADLMSVIGADGWRIAPDDDRQTLLDAVTCNPQAAARAAAVWTALTDNRRAMLSRAPGDIDAWKAQEYAAALETLAPPQSAAALETMARAPDTAARLGVALWDALDNEQRSTIARSADAAARLDDDQSAALARAKLDGAGAMRATSQALADGLPWRDWKTRFLPAATDDADVWDAWRAVIHRTPPHVAARLSPQRRTSR